MRNNKKTLLTILLLLLLVISISYVASTYAKYTAEVTRAGTATIATWAFEDDNSASTTLTINFEDTYHETTLADGKIAPGTSGSFAIQLVNTNSEVGVDFSLVLDDIANKPTNLKFYKDDTFTTELTVGTDEITGQITAGDSTGVSIPVYWEWKYETNGTAGDPDDTTAGTSTNKELTIGATITGVQTEPGAAITTHID